LSLFSQNVGASTTDPLFQERVAERAGYRWVAGVDEAGRGPLAGPVVAAAVILPWEIDLGGVRDSKQMTARAREEAFGVIQEKAVSTGIGVVSHRYIDEIDILRASLEAMRRAVAALEPQPDLLLVDGPHGVPAGVLQLCLNHGDSLSLSISAASVLAKVYRDRIMLAYHGMYPAYGFDTNKGYGTRAHRRALGEHGSCPFHRVSFKEVPAVDEAETGAGAKGGGPGR